MIHNLESIYITKREYICSIWSKSLSYARPTPNSYCVLGLNIRIIMGVPAAYKLTNTRKFIEL